MTAQRGDPPLLEVSMVGLARVSVSMIPSVATEAGDLERGVRLGLADVLAVLDAIREVLIELTLATLGIPLLALGAVLGFGLGLIVGYW